ncbi:4a-hydroxytetrahydrobiopterin dehydratase [Neobacillus niacini]|uniref:4a-hydroxytetrahydrobiopterin dehydratase n=1 Tax=Neobacillus niacini TaxID=86668 RepID=UPI0021CAEDE1|nr:4a-hydroxytetrahydrobiopterin dehydratase [Neobacillus niacini]MCM3768349.1 4a-hydroxytetrahydrobiopterin dehydratase [Neobacillus niacini]
MRRLTDEEISNEVAGLSGWKLDEKFIMKKYRFKEFLTGVAFVNSIANLSEVKNHHPFISIDYKMVTLKLTSWHAGGITDLDIALAKQYDALYEKHN